MKAWVLKGLVPAVAAMLSMSALVAMAGPGDFVDVSDDGGSEPDVGESGGEAGDEGDCDCFLTVLSDGANAYLVLQEHVSDAEMPEGGVAGNQNALDRICFGTLNGSQEHTRLVPGHSGDAPGNSGDAPGHSGDAPGKSGDAPGHSGDAPGNSGDAPGKSGDAPGTGGDGADAFDNGPGKSEDAPGEPAAPGQALGEGQEKADAMGLGPSEAPGQNKP